MKPSLLRLDKQIDEELAVKERPILFSGPMVKAILEGRKTQTRRVMNPQPSPAFLVRGLVEAVPQWPHQNGVRFFMADGLSELLPSKHGAPGDRLWVRETFLNNALEGYEPVYFYRADDDDKPEDRSWRPSIFMPRKASRITLEITGVRVERLQDISKADCIAEGMTDLEDVHAGWHQSYARLWDSINAKKHPWKSNCWVWVIEFKKV